MNKRQIFASLNKIANELDTNGLFKEANEVTEVMVKLSQSLIGNSGFGAGGNIPLGIDPSMSTTPTGPMQTSEEIGQIAQDWINKKSLSVKGDINQLVSMAYQAKMSAKNAGNDSETKKFNHVLFILKNHPKFKGQSSLGNVRSMERNPEADSSLGGVRSYEGAQEAKAKKYPY